MADLCTFSIAESGRPNLDARDRPVIAFPQCQVRIHHCKGAGLMTGGAAPEFVVVGGGIGGLTAARVLHASGRSVRILEAAPELGDVGVGITVLPHASRVLADLGLLSSLTNAAVATRESYEAVRPARDVGSGARQPGQPTRLDLA